MCVCRILEREKAALRERGREKTASGDAQEQLTSLTPHYCYEWPGVELVHVIFFSLFLLPIHSDEYECYGAVSWVLCDQVGFSTLKEKKGKRKKASPIQWVKVLL